MAKFEKKEIKLNANDFDLPPVKMGESKIKITTPQLDNFPKTSSVPKKENYLRLDLDGVQIVKVGFEYPKSDDKDIELIAVLQGKHKKVLLAEIVREWLEKNKNKIL